MTSYISVDLGIRGASSTFWILSDYDTGFARVIGEQSGLDLVGTAEFTDRLARKHQAVEVLVNATGPGAGLTASLVRIERRPYQVVNILSPAAKGAVA